jgi:hypothetical protein
MMKKINELVKEFEKYMVDHAGISPARIVHISQFARNNKWMDKKLEEEYKLWLSKKKEQNEV